MADIVIINPRFDVSYWGLEHAMPFLGSKAILPVASLPLLAALTPPPHAVTLIDENVEAIDFERCARADIVGITGMNVQRARMHEILAELKRRACFTVVGGPWVTVKEDDIAGLADVIFIGEAEETWPRFLTEWGQGRHARRYEQAERTNMASVPPPRLDLLRMKDYGLGSVQFSRGCPFECEFCDIIVTFGRRPRIKTSAQVLAELDGLRATGKRTVFIVDDNLIGNKRAIKPILREVIAWQEAHGHPLMFATEASIDLADDPELMRLMVDAGVSELFVGIETPNEASLRETKKLQNLRARGGSMLDKVHRIQEAGMEVWCGMIVGFDNDGEDIFAAQRRFISESRIVNAMINMLVAIPRTPLYHRLEREGRLDNSDDPAGFGPFGTNVIPLRMGRQVLRDGYVELMRELYSPTAFFHRVDALYLEARLRWGRARQHYLRRHPLRRAKLNARLLAEAVAIFLMLMRGVPDPALRREYRRRLLRAVWRRPAPAILQLYAIKCALHFHFHTMVLAMQSTPRPVALGAAA
ncbi:MAG: B12-binding domain-containing radical SAM protein [Alphaproteobacteria bacterium]|nr:B12-binding domain-containing radical SAM protein [Alphaproteobacteria bacterium]